MHPFNKQQEEQIRDIIRDELGPLIAKERYLFQKHIQIFDGRDIQTGRTTGTKLGTAADQKVALHGTTPTIQDSAISNTTVTGTDTDAAARTAINSILAVLRNKGIIAT